VAKNLVTRHPDWTVVETTGAAAEAKPRAAPHALVFATADRHQFASIVNASPRCCW
jgi:hypothetical protein